MYSCHLLFHVALHARDPSHPNPYVLSNAPAKAVICMYSDSL